MGSVALAEAWPRHGEPFTVEVVPSRLVAKLRAS